MDNTFNLIPNTDDDNPDQDQSYMYRHGMPSQSTNNSTALNWWFEESKILGLESQPDVCLTICDQLVPVLERYKEQDLAKSRSKRKKKLTEELEQAAKAAAENPGVAQGQEIAGQPQDTGNNRLTEAEFTAALDLMDVSDPQAVSTQASVENQNISATSTQLGEMQINTDSGRQATSSTQTAVEQNQANNQTEANQAVSGQHPGDGDSEMNDASMPPPHVETIENLNNDSLLLEESEDSVDENLHSQRLLSIFSDEGNSDDDDDSDSDSDEEDNEQYIDDQSDNQATPNEQPTSQQNRSDIIVHTVAEINSHFASIPNLSARQDTDMRNIFDALYQRSDQATSMEVSPSPSQPNEESNGEIQAAVRNNEQSRNTGDGQMDIVPNEEGAVGGGSSTTISEIPATISNPENIPAPQEVPSGPSIASQQDIDPAIRSILGDLEVPEGIDASFLAALPPEMREEVIAEHMRQQRIRQRATQPPPAPTDVAPVAEVNPEFLAALPLNIQEEVLAQQRLEQQRQAAVSMNPNDPVDAAAFFQNLTPSLRQAVSIQNSYL